MEEKVWNCITKRLTGTETEESGLFLDQWLAEETDHNRQYNEAKSLWDLSALLPAGEPDVSFNQFSKHAGLKETPAGPLQKEVKPFHFWRFGIAAALTAVVLLAGLFSYKINPGRTGAEDWIVKKAGPGKVIKVYLPDSSVVWLNSGSEIRFARYFNHGKLRTIRLSGEAYFEVKHDKAHPFVVTSAGLTTTVYGTSFSIRAYGNEAQTSVAVNTGKVGVTGTDQQHKERSIMLLPDDKLTYHTRAGKFVKSAVAPKDVNSWVRGDLVFEQAPLDEVLETLARKYNVRIHAERKQYAACRLTARFSNQPLQTVLKTLGLSLNIQSKQIGQTIYLKGGSCM